MRVSQSQSGAAYAVDLDEGIHIYIYFNSWHQYEQNEVLLDIFSRKKFSLKSRKGGPLIEFHFLEKKMFLSDFAHFLRT